MQVYCRECKAAAKEVSKERQEEKRKSEWKTARPAVVGLCKGRARYIGAFDDTKLDLHLRRMVSRDMKSPGCEAPRVPAVRLAESSPPVPVSVAE
jgi:hypothetical protein